MFGKSENWRKANAELHEEALERARDYLANEQAVAEQVALASERLPGPLSKAVHMSPDTEKDLLRAFTAVLAALRGFPSEEELDTRYGEDRPLASGAAWEIGGEAVQLAYPDLTEGEERREAGGRIAYLVHVATHAWREGWDKVVWSEARPLPVLKRSAAATPRNKLREILFPQNLWQRVKKEAERQGASSAEVVRRAVRRHLDATEGC